MRQDQPLSVLGLDQADHAPDQERQHTRRNHAAGGRGHGFQRQAQDQDRRDQLGCAEREAGGAWQQRDTRLEGSRCGEGP